jgi:hypothetical protein
MQYRLRTLLIVLALGPPLVARLWLTREQTVAALQRTNFQTWICLAMVILGFAVAVRGIKRAASGSL